jgi:hypothetical protein
MLGVLFQFLDYENNDKKQKQNLQPPVTSRAPMSPISASGFSHDHRRCHAGCPVYYGTDPDLTAFTY